jgi:hypothetical protein
MKGPACPTRMLPRRRAGGIAPPAPPLRLFGDHGQQVPHEVNAIALPAGFVQDLGDRLTQALVSVGDHQPHAPKATLDERAQERHPELVVLARARLRTKNGALTGRGHADRDHGRDRDHPPGLANLVERCVEPEVGALLIDPTPEEGPHLLVEGLADPRDLGLGDPVASERPDQVIDLAGRDPLHVGLHDDRVQCLLRPPTRLQQRGEVGTGGELRDLELDRAGSRVPARVR